MIFKDKSISFSLFVVIKSFIKKLIQFLGFIFLFFIITIFYYYYSSGLYLSFGIKESFLRLNKAILDKYIGLDLTKLPDYINLYVSKYKYKISNEKLNLPIIKIELNQKSILFLENQREIKINNIETGIAPESKSTKAKIQIDNYKDSTTLTKTNIKIKGDRAIHWFDPKETSYRFALSKEDKLFGMKKFSIQKPIIRNYTYEFLFHKFLKQTDHLYLKYFLVNLEVNGQKKGIYALEEGFSKEIIESQQRRNGPIFSLDENFGAQYPFVSYQVYSSKSWETHNREMVKIAFSILNQIKNGEVELIKYFDEDKWASYFAIIDVMGAHHGSLSKSVRLYYNPLSGKFEPLGYDAHIGAGDFSNFLLSDFLQDGNINCTYICSEKNWYLKFFKSKNNELNYDFVKKYIYYLKKYSDKEFVINFLKKNQKDIDAFNNIIYSENSKVDKVLYKGFGPFLFDNKFIFKRAELIKNRIETLRLDQYQISLNNKKLTVKDNLNNFPMEAETTECNNQSAKKFYFAGVNEINWPYQCKKLTIIKNKDEKKIFELKENLKLSKNYNFISLDDFDLLSNNTLITKISDNYFEINNNIEIKKNMMIKNFQTLRIKEGINIYIGKNAVLLLGGKIFFDGSKDKPISITSDKTGSIIFNKNVVNMNYVNFDNLGYPKLKAYNFMSGLNFFESQAILSNINISNANSEDAINLVRSKSNLENIHFKNTFSDALDADFGSLKFKNITCENVGNDCLDFSGTNVDGEYLLVKKAKDKGISAGEITNVNINNIEISEVSVGIAVKDGSKGIFNNIKLKNNKYDLAAFNKKSEHESPELSASNITYDKNKLLISKNTNININNKIYKGSLTNKYINSIIY